MQDEQMSQGRPCSEPDVTLDRIAVTCVALGLDRESLSESERAIVRDDVVPLDVAEVRSRILVGEDPLGQAFCSARSAEERRPFGQTFTPGPVVQAMLDWSRSRVRPVRVIDPRVRFGAIHPGGPARVPEGPGNRRRPGSPRHADDASQCAGPRRGRPSRGAPRGLPVPESLNH